MNVSLNSAWTRLQATVQELIMNLPTLLIGAVEFLLFLFVARLVRRAVHAVALRTGQAEGVANVLARLASWVVLVIGVLILQGPCPQQRSKISESLAEVNRSSRIR